jgi:NADH dehydrogenase [ubiquinone] 1 alpha subcomplex assembly factor 5
MSANHLIFDRELLARRRQRVASAAAGHDFLLRRVAEDLAWRLSLIKRAFPMAVNLGAHHGLVSRALRTLPGVDVVIDTDTSAALLGQCDGPCLVADEELLPFAPRSLDLVLSGLALQFVNDLPGTLIQIERALKPDGLFLGAMLGGETLTELRQALVAAETETTGGASPRVAPFADVRDLGGLLQRAGFALPVADSDLIEVAYPSALELMRDLRGMGAANVLLERARRPLRRATLLRAIEIYQERFARPDGRVTASFEILTLTGWSPHTSQQQALRPGSAKSRLADALGVPEVGTGDAPK